VTFIWILLIAKVVCCAVAVAPTLFFMRCGRWLKETYRRHVERRLERAFAKLAGDFYCDESFFDSGVGLAADFCERRFFVAERNGGRVRAAVLPFSALRGVTSGAMNQNGFYDVYVELKVDHPNHPIWRLLLGENEALANAVKDTLGRLQSA
jgi:hypothetical protein